MHLKTLCLTLKSERPVTDEDASKLRGYIANQFKEYPILHHHVAEAYVYTYPRVQYKIIEGAAIMLGIEEGARGCTQEDLG